MSEQVKPLSEAERSELVSRLTSLADLLDHPSRVRFRELAQRYDDDYASKRREAYVLRKEIDALKAERDQFREILRSVEWVDYGEIAGLESCPSCFACRYSGEKALHYSTCALANALGSPTALPVNLNP